MYIKFVAGAIIFILWLMYFLQTTIWSQDWFQLGLVIRKRKEYFYGKIPPELLRKEIVCDNVLFNFSSPAKGLFRVYPKFPKAFKSRRKFYSPLILGEIFIKDNSKAEIILRIPISVILTWLSLLVILVSSIINGGFILDAFMGNITNIVLVMIIFSILLFIRLDIEKIDLEDGIKELSEKIKSDTL